MARRRIEAKILAFDEPGPFGVPLSREGVTGKVLPSGLVVRDDGIYYVTDTDDDGSCVIPQMQKAIAAALGMGRAEE